MSLPFKDLEKLLQIARDVRDNPSPENEEAFHTALLNAKLLATRLESNNPILLNIREDKIIIKDDSSPEKIRQIVFSNDDVVIEIYIDNYNKMISGRVFDEMYPQYWMEARAQVFSNNELIAFTETKLDSEFELKINQSGQMIVHIIYGDGTQIHLEKFSIP